MNALFKIILISSCALYVKLFSDIQEQNNYEQKSHEPISCSKCCILTEYKPAYFYYQDNTFRKIFNDGGFLSLFGFDVKTYKILHVWLDAGFLYDKGKVEATDDAKTTIKLIPISFGLKCQLTFFKVICPYFKLGLNQFYITNTNFYAHVDSKVHKHYFGFTVGTGCLINLYKGLSANFIIDYLYNRRKFTSRSSFLPIKVYVGGIAFGAGLGYQF